MTRDKNLAVYRTARRAASLIIAAVLVAGLTGCGNSLLGAFETTDASLTQKAKPTVAFAPVQVQGGPDKYASAINEKFANTAKEKGVTLADVKEAQYVVKAAYRAVPEQKKGTKVAYEIDVTDKTGALVKKMSGEELVSEKRGGISWNHVTDEAIQRVAAKSAAEIYAWIDNPNAVPQPPAAIATAPAAVPAPAAAKPAPQKVAAVKASAPKGNLSAAVSPEGAASVPANAALVKQAANQRSGEVIAVVPAVIGAPGDGKTALANSMRKALIQQGVKVASAANASTYKVQGKVEVGTASNGLQPVKIRWVVIDPSGKQLEKIVTQDNQVDEGRLDREWGEIADQAAGAAAIEVGKILPKPATGQAQQSQGRAAG